MSQRPLGDTVALGAFVADGQTQKVQGGVLARKLARARAMGANLDDIASAQGIDDAENFAPMQPAPDPFLRAWRLALARAARDHLKLTVGFQDIAHSQVSLTEVLETPMQRALILMLQGTGEGMGLMIFSGQMLSAMVEILTLTHLSPDVPDAADLRKPTRTDAAMMVEFVDAALIGFEAGTGEPLGAQALNWATGYRYAAFIDDPRPLHLMLEDIEYHLMSAQLVLEDGVRHGQIWLALPHAPPSQILPECAPLDLNYADAPAVDLIDHSFTEQMAAHVHELPAQLDACLAQIALPLERLMGLQVGEVLALPTANLDHISVMGLDGLRLGRARLGQNRGMRALRLTDVAFVQPHGLGTRAGQAETLAHMGAPTSLQPVPPQQNPPDLLGNGAADFQPDQALALDQAVGE